MEELVDHTQPDPLLKPGSFIDPNPPSNGTPRPSSSEPFNKHSTPKASQPSDRREEIPVTEKPDWLPPDWSVTERVRASGASAGTRDKYYVEPVTLRRFRSKKEVLHYLETGSRKKNKKGSDASDNMSGSNASPAKRKKSEPKERDLMKNFNFDDVPETVKWELVDIYEGTWRASINGERVPESTQQEWAAAFAYLALQNGGRG